MKYYLLIIVLVLIGCTPEGTSQKEAKYGHWIFRGSATFKQIFQCVDEFKPHQNQEC